MICYIGIGDRLLSLFASYFIRYVLRTFSQRSGPSKISAASHSIDKTLQYTIGQIPFRIRACYLIRYILR